jgi:hypothetical protein
MLIYSRFMGYIIWHDRDIGSISWDNVGITFERDRDTIVPEILNKFGDMETFNKRLSSLVFDCLSNSRSQSYGYLWMRFQFAFVACIVNVMQQDGYDMLSSVMFWSWIAWLVFAVRYFSKAGLGCCGQRVNEDKFLSEGNATATSLLGLNVKGGISRDRNVRLSYFPVPQMYAKCNRISFHFLSAYYSLSRALQYVVTVAVLGIGIGAAVGVTNALKVTMGVDDYGDDWIEETEDYILVGMTCFGIFTSLSFCVLMSFVAALRWVWWVQNSLAQAKTVRE